MVLIFIYVNYNVQYLNEEQGKQRNWALSLQCMLEDLFRMAIMDAFPELESPPVQVVLSAKTADYQCNSAMSLAQV